jgi:S-adenosylmethionine-diacylgycerolhomoserine-N-methlytransferase
VSAATDIRVMLHLLRGMPRGGDAAARLQAFYAPQADAYDDFRERLLKGRGELVRQLVLPARARVVELGAGTGRNLDHFGERLNAFESFELVDLCPALLAEARKRAVRHPNVQVVEADAARYRPESPADCVIFSYSLTMIPEWRAALDNAVTILKPDGQLAVVDFTTAPQQGRLASAFWRSWFGHDGVHLDRQHVHELRERCWHQWFDERRAAIPYLPGLRVPYYLFIGQPLAGAQSSISMPLPTERSV